MDERSSVLNEILESKPIPNKLLKQFIKRLPKSVCFIETEKVMGTGAILEIKENPKYCCLVTCFHVLSPEFVCNSLIKFERCEKFTLKPEWIVRISFKPKGKGDYMAIVLQPEAVTFLENQNLVFLKVCRADKFLKVKSANSNDNVRHIIVMGYHEAENDNPEMSTGYGSISSINGFTIEYSAATAEGGSGSPLILWSGEVIGIHRSRHCNPGSNERYATNLTEIQDNLFLDFGTFMYVKLFRY